MGILVKLRTKVPKFSMRTSNLGGGEVFLVSSELKSLSPPWEVQISGEGVFFSELLTPSPPWVLFPGVCGRGRGYSLSRKGYSVGFDNIFVSLKLAPSRQIVYHTLCVETNDLLCIAKGAHEQVLPSYYWKMVAYQNVTPEPIGVVLRHTGVG